MPTSIIIRYAIGAIIAIALQALISTNMQIGLATPNMVLCYVIACSLAAPREIGPVMPFICGLVYDLMSGGPVGGMACACLAVSLMASTAFNLVENSSLPMVILFCAISSAVGELIYGALMIACGSSVGLLEALTMVSLPSALYDTLIALLAYVLCARFVFRDKEQIEMTIIDSGQE